jgi:hypothetical protein
MKREKRSQESDHPPVHAMSISYCSGCIRIPLEASEDQKIIRGGGTIISRKLLYRPAARREKLKMEKHRSQ